MTIKEKETSAEAHKNLLQFSKLNNLFFDPLSSLPIIQCPTHTLYLLTEKALRKTKHWIIPSIVSPVKQNVPVRWRPFRPTADANEAWTRALRPAAVAATTAPPFGAPEDEDDSDEESHEEDAAAATTALPARTTLLGNGAARINRSNESILTLHTFLLLHSSRSSNKDSDKHEWCFASGSPEASLTSSIIYPHFQFALSAGPQSSTHSLRLSHRGALQAMIRTHNHYCTVWIKLIGRCCHHWLNNRLFAATLFGRGHSFYRRAV